MTNSLVEGRFVYGDITTQAIYEHFKFGMRCACSKFWQRILSVLLVLERRVNVKQIFSNLWFDCCSGLHAYTCTNSGCESSRIFASLKCIKYSINVFMNLDRKCCSVFCSRHPWQYLKPFCSQTNKSLCGGNFGRNVLTFCCSHFVIVCFTHAMERVLSIFCPSIVMPCPDSVERACWWAM